MAAQKEAPMARPRAGEEKHRPIHIGVRVSKELNAALRKIADKRDSPLSDVVNEALDAYVKRQTKGASR
jgi:hypothetical protein